MSPSDSFDCRITVQPRADGSCLVPVSGEIDAASSSRLLEHIRDAFAFRPRFVQVDMSGVSFIDCAGLRALWDGALEARWLGIPVRLTPTSRPVTRLLDVAGAIEWLDWSAESSQTANIRPPSIGSVAGH